MMPVGSALTTCSPNTTSGFGSTKAPSALGNLVRFVLLPGQRYDTVGLPPLIEGVAFKAFIADKAFDADWIIEELNQRGAKIVVSQRPDRLRPLATTKRSINGDI